jgi:hypothetical protein
MKGGIVFVGILIDILYYMLLSEEQLQILDQIYRKTKQLNCVLTNLLKK